MAYLFFQCNISHVFVLIILVPEFSIYNPRALFRKSLSNNIDFLNSASGVVYGKLKKNAIVWRNA